jgi:hypothetical protein
MFERDWNGDRSRVLDKPNPAAAWVFAGEGVATRKYDGMACMYDGATWYKRRELKAGQEAPAAFHVADHDEETGKVVGWIPVGDGPEDRYIREAIENETWQVDAAPGTFEFIGPKSQGNVEKIDNHLMMRHADAEKYPDAPRTFDGLRDFLAERDIEGIVFHHPDGRMAKIKKRDFGLKRVPATPPPAEGAEALPRGCAASVGPSSSTMSATGIPVPNGAPL